MKILHLASPNLGGIESYIFSHYKYMDQDKFQFDFMTQNQSLREAEEYRNFQFHVKLLPTTAAKEPEVFTRRVYEILSEGYDVLHLHTCFWTGFRIEEIAREIGIKKVIVHSHSSAIDETDVKKREMLLKRHEEVKRSFSPDLATDFWACSWKAADWLFGEQIPRSTIRVMKNAIEVERFRFDARLRQATRKELGLEDAWVLGTVGRLSFQKNHAFLLELFRAFHEKYPNAKLLMIGNGELQCELERQIRESGLKDAVLLLGWKASVENYLQAMDCFLLPSRFEGNPISLIEAAASGLPAVIADTITEEAVIADTILREPLDISRWIFALEEVLRKPIDRREGEKTVRMAGYDVRQQAKALEILYESQD